MAIEYKLESRDPSGVVRKNFFEAVSKRWTSQNMRDCSLTLKDGKRSVEVSGDHMEHPPFVVVYSRGVTTYCEHFPDDFSGALARAHEIIAATRFASYEDANGNLIELEGESVEALHRQLPEDFDRRLAVSDEAGFTRGWIGKGGWSAT